MTGHQPNACSEPYDQPEGAKRIDLEGLIKALGVEHMRVEDAQESGNRALEECLFGGHGIRRVGLHDGVGMDDGLQLRVEVVGGASRNGG